MSRLLDATGEAPFVFVTGKGGTGKTTTACALGLSLADAGVATHLISTDPAHSIADVFRQAVGPDIVTAQCSPLLRLEEHDATAASARWVARALQPVSALVESGTYLDGEDVTAFSRLALPGIDEMMAVLRLSELADTATEATARVIVDTAPTGHTLRLLDAADVHDGIARALRAMADKAAAVAGAMTGRAVRMQGEEIIEELEHTVRTYRERVLRPAAFVITTRDGPVVAAETRRLTAALNQRSLRTVAVVVTGDAAYPDVEGVALVHVPWLPGATGCDGLRAWRSHATAGRAATPGPGPAATADTADAADAADAAAMPDAAAWLRTRSPRRLLFAGKGGVGKSTCAAAAAIALSQDHSVLLCSTDPAGSLGDVMGAMSELPERLRVVQIDPGAELGRLRESWEREVLATLEQVGLSEGAVLDRRVIDALWHLTPPGVDELAGTAAMLRAARSGETVVVDSAPTGHFLRLLEMPDIALAWTRQLMRVFVKYGIAGVAGGAAESLLELSRELRSLRETLRDADATAVIVVSLEEPVVRAETTRLAAALDDAGVHVLAELLNRAGPGAQPTGAAGTAIRAPIVMPPPVGPAALRDFVDQWRIVA